MNDCPVTVWYGVSASMLKHHPPGLVNACEKPSCPPQDTSPRAREGARRSSNSVTVSVERVGSLIERLFHHRVLRRQCLNAQTSPPGPSTRVHKRRTVLAQEPPRGSRRVRIGLGTGS